LTGWAQIKGGRWITPADKAALDEWYVRNVSLTLDLKILLGTVPILIFGEWVTEEAITHARREIEFADSVPGLMTPEISRFCASGNMAH
jgi:hypothetical protein